MAAETNDLNIEEEALKIVCSMEKVKNFLLKLDHKQLEFIFNPRKELPRVTLFRILR